MTLQLVLRQLGDFGYTIAKAISKCDSKACGNVRVDAMLSPRSDTAQECMVVVIDTTPDHCYWHLDFDPSTGSYN